MSAILDRTEHWPWHWFAVIAVTILAVIAVASGLQGRADIREAQIESCNRGNTVRADRRLDERGGPDNSDRAARIFPLLDCDATIHGDGDQVPLTKQQAALFITIVKGSRAPIVQDGEVVGSIAFPVPP